MQEVIAAITTWPWSSSVSRAVGERDLRADRYAVGHLHPAGAGARVLALVLVRRLGLLRGGRVGGREGLLERLVALVGFGDEPVERHPERRLRLGQRHAVLRALRARQRRHDVAEVELQRLRVGRLLRAGVVPQPLLARVRLDQLDPLLRAAGELEVAQRLGVDREHRARRAELRAHVADRRAVGERQVRHARAVELDELADHAVLAQHLGDGEHEVGRGRSLRQLAGQPEADHARDQHRHRLAEHRRLGLDPAHSPAEHAEAVDHRGVRVGPDQRVGVQRAVVVEHHARQVLEVDLVDDPGAGRHDPEALERALAPAQERVALVVALELALDVDAEGVARAEDVDLDRVVDHQLGRHERVDLRGIAAEIGHRVAHRGEVDDRGHAREVLHHHARGREGDLLRRLGAVVPGGDRLDVLLADADAVLVAQDVLEQDLERERQARDVELRLERV